MNILGQWQSRRLARSNNRSVPACPFECASRTDAGSRELNEDRLLERSDLGLWAIADGMGGHECGEFAAQCVIDALSTVEPRSSAEIVTAVRLANAKLRKREGHAGVSGSTVIILRIDGEQFDCLWAGDSEMWLASNGELRKVSRDHSVVEELVRSGLIQESQRHSHPQAHLITRAVGAAESIELDCVSGRVSVGDVFLLCSDGLTKAVSHKALSVLLSRDTLEDMASTLLASALEQGASDNVTLVLVRIGEGDRRGTPPMKSKDVIDTIERTAGAGGKTRER
jgi:serine/threonine-protein phosphatase Stp1